MGKSISVGAIVVHKHNKNLVYKNSRSSTSSVCMYLWVYYWRPYCYHYNTIRNFLLTWILLWGSVVIGPKKMKLQLVGFFLFNFFLPLSFKLCMCVFHIMLIWYEQKKGKETKFSFPVSSHIFYCHVLFYSYFFLKFWWKWNKWKEDNFWC